MKIQVNENQLKRVLIKLQDQRITNRIHETKEEVLEKLAIDWLNKRYGNLKTEKRNIYIEPISNKIIFGPKWLGDRSKFKEMSIYVNEVKLNYVDNEIMMIWDGLKNSYIIINDNIWSRAQSFFHLKYNETKSIMKKWLKNTYGIENAEPVSPNSELEYIFNSVEDGSFDE
jgi:hypothetical protein